MTHYEQADLPRRERLSHRLAMALGGTTFFFVTVVSFILSWSNFERELLQRIDSLEGTAKIFATSIAEPFAQDHRRDVNLSLTAIGKFDSYQHVSVTGNNGATYAQMGFDNHLIRKTYDGEDKDLLAFLYSDTRTVSVPVIHSGVQIGKLSLTSDISDSRAALIQSLIFNLIMAAILAVLSVLVAGRFIKTITRPLHVMSTEMVRMRLEGAYDANLPTETKGEVGVLSNAFGSLLSDIRLRDKQLLDHQANLERKVAARTRDLEVAKTAAEEANAAKSDFLATMSHEIRTPMNGMLVMAELLATADMEPRHRRYAEVVMKSGKGLVTIINDILDLSKIQAGKLSLENIATNPSALAEDTLSLFWQQASEKGVDLACHVGPTVPSTIMADPTRLNQIITNLINNALKFTVSGEVRLLIDASRHNGDKCELTITVEDSGIGIPPDKLSTVFDSFSQADQSTTRRYGGTGLGLAICRKLADAMGGELTATSQEGEGSAFTLTLPAAQIVEPAENREKEGNVPDKTGQSLLITYPDSFTRKVLSEALERLGFEITLQSDEGSLDHDTFDWIVAPLDYFKRHFFASRQQQRIALVKMGDGGVEDLMTAGAISDFISLPVTSTSTIRRIADRDRSVQPSGVNRPVSARDNITLFKNAKILVTDDSTVNREVVDQALRQFNIRPDLVSNGYEALEALSGQSYDLVFMDCSMPDLDGFEATRKLRADETGGESLPVIALTAHAADNVTEKAAASGMNDILVKPFTIADLNACLLKWIPHKARKHAPDKGNDNLLPADSSSTSVPVPLSTERDEVFDPQLLANLKEISGDGFDATYRQLKALFVQSAPSIYEQMQTAFAANNLDDIRSTAHALKSMSLNIGAKLLADRLSVLEEVNETTDHLVPFTVAEQQYLRLMEVLNAEELPPQTDVKQLIV